MSALSFLQTTNNDELFSRFKLRSQGSLVEYVRGYAGKNDVEKAALTILEVRALLRLLAGPRAVEVMSTEWLSPEGGFLFEGLGRIGRGGPLAAGSLSNSWVRRQLKQRGLAAGMAVSYVQDLAREIWKDEFDPSDLLELDIRRIYPDSDEAAEAQLLRLGKGASEEQSGLEENGVSVLEADRIRRIPVQDQLQAALHHLTQLGFTYQILDQSLVEEFPKLAVLAELHQGILIDRSDNPAETRNLVAELISHSTYRVNYYGYSERADRFREIAERAMIKVEIQTSAEFGLLLTQLLSNLSGLNDPNLLQTRLEQMGLTLQRIVSWLDQLA